MKAGIKIIHNIIKHPVREKIATGRSVICKTTAEQEPHQKGQASIQAHQKFSKYFQNNRITKRNRNIETRHGKKRHPNKTLDLTTRE